MRRQEHEVSDATAVGPVDGDEGRSFADQLEARGRGTAECGYRGGYVYGCGDCGGHDEPLRLLGVGYGCRVSGHDGAGVSATESSGSAARRTPGGPVRLEGRGHDVRARRAERDGIRDIGARRGNALSKKS